MRQKIKKECKNCGKIFITFDESVEFCNLGCKEDYANPPMGAIPESKRAKLLEKKCIVCGKVFLTKRYDKIYCSNKCGNKAFRDRENQTHIYEIKICHCCGKELPKGTPHFARYCSDCREKIKSIKEYNRERLRMTKKQCVVCHNEFIPNSYNQKYCFYCDTNMPHIKREKAVEEMKKDENVIKQEPTRNPVTHNYIDLRIDFENQLEQLKNARNDCIEQKKKSEEIIAWLTPKIELLDDVIDQMKKCESNND